MFFRINFLSIIAVSAILCFVNCSKRDFFDSEESHRSRNFYIKPKSGTEYYHNSDSLPIYTSSKKHHFDSVRLYLNGHFLKRLTSSSGKRFYQNLDVFLLGSNKFEIRGYYNQKNYITFSKEIIVIPENEPQTLHHEVINKFAHNPGNFTQGLILKRDTIIESTGGYGSSSLLIYNYRTGEVFLDQKLSAAYFGEGVTELNQKIYQLTYKENKILVYDAKSYDLMEEVDFPSDGWGITHNDSVLIMSNGSADLFFIDPGTFETCKNITVYDHSGPVKYINELEYINGKIYANVWQKDEIIVINPHNGIVEFKIKLEELAKENKPLISFQNVLNGIAYCKETKKLLVTGKRWPFLYEIKILNDDKENVSP